MLSGMDIKITAVEARVLGALVEKEITTPEYYPLSLNALVNACNQKSNREPVMNLDEDAVVAAMRALDEREFAGRGEHYGQPGAEIRAPVAGSFQFYAAGDGGAVRVAVARSADAGRDSRAGGAVAPFRGVG